MATPKRWRARPVEIEAERWTGEFSELPAEWRTSEFLVYKDGRLTIRTLNHRARVRIGDYIVRGTAGEFYPVPTAIFEYKYEALT